MSNIPIKDANDASRRVDTFQRTDGADTVETQAVALIDPANGNPVRPDASGNMPIASPALGTPADVAATGDGSIIGILKRIRAILGGILSVDATGSAVTVINFPTTQAVSGTVTANTGLSQPLTDTQLRASAVPVSAASLPLPAGAASESTLASLNAKVPAQGQAAMAASLPVVIASNQSNVPIIPPAAPVTSFSQAGVIAINTILATLDCSQYRSISIQCVSMGTSGVVTPEWSNDNATWVAATLFTPAGASATTFNAAGLWVLPVFARYLRLRLSTATTAGTTTLSVYQFDTPSQEWLATQPVSGTVTANIGTGSIAAGTNAIGDIGLQYRANATGAAGFVSVQSPATPAAATIKGSAGRLLGWQLQNSSTGVRSVKIFNATAPTLGTTAASFEIDIPAGGRSEIQLPGGIGFATAMTYSVTSAKGLTDNTATGLAANDVSGAFFFA